MKALRLATVFGAFVALMLAVAPIAYSQQKSGTAISLPGTTGPSLGDTNTNLFTVVQALQNSQTANFFSYTTITVSAGQTTSTLLQYGMNFLTAAVGTTATMVMPTAKPGTEIFIVNNTGAGLALFGSATPFTVGGQDYINNVIGNQVGPTPPYGVSASKAVQCFVPQGGNWWCMTGS